MRLPEPERVVRGYCPIWKMSCSPPITPLCPARLEQVEQACTMLDVQIDGEHLREQIGGVVECVDVLASEKALQLALASALKGGIDGRR